MKKQMKNKWLLLLIISLGIAGILSLVTSSQPDGLEASAQQIGLTTENTNFTALIPDYIVPGIPNKILASSLAGIIGTVLVFNLSYLFTWHINKKTKIKSI
jgi:cobalt/nickel transport protein